MNQVTKSINVIGNASDDIQEKYKNLIDDVMVEYNKMQSLSRLLDKTTNETAIKVITEEYVKAEIQWNKNINTLGTFILYYVPEGVQYNLFVDFNSLEVRISFENIDKEIFDKITENVKTVGWIFK
nr:MAG TPA: hypothetical protein [Caudoviricetes sp.]